MALLDRYLSENEIVTEIRAKTGMGCVRTLRSWRARRKGPPWATLGKAIVYPIDGFEAWLKAQVQQPVRSRQAA
jgi:hypothetical protein